MVDKSIKCLPHQLNLKSRPNPTMKNPRSWLEQETPHWVRDGLLSPEQAGRIRARYPARAALPWGLIVFSGLGAVIVGLGVALLIAYNWSDIPKFGKLALVFASVIGAHAGALRLRAAGGWQASLGEAVALLGTMLFGAGIWLVAQVYHIDEHFPNGFLLWGLGALALAWAMDSVPQALLATVLLTVWGCVEVFEFHAAFDWAWVLVAVGAGALAWRKNSWLLLGALLASLYVLVLANAGHWGGADSVFVAAFSLSVLLLALQALGTGERFGQFGRAVLGFFGHAGFLTCAFLLTFDDVARDALRWKIESGAELGTWVYRGLWPVAALGVWGAVLWRNRPRPPLDAWVSPLALILVMIVGLTGGWADFEATALVFNLVVLGIAAAWMMRGCRSGELRPTILGSLLLSALVFARYFDLFDNLAVRGVVFLVLGGVLFAEGFYYRKLRQAERTNEGGAS